MALVTLMGGGGGRGIDRALPAALCAVSLQVRVFNFFNFFIFVICSRLSVSRHLYETYLIFLFDIFGYSERLFPLHFLLPHCGG